MSLPNHLETNPQNLLTASLRAPEGYNLPEAMNQNIELYLKCGGHQCAAGFSAVVSNLEAIKSSLSASLKNQRLLFEPEIITGFEHELLPIEVQKLGHKKNVIYCEINDLTMKFLGEVLELDPFGQHFPMPELLFGLKLSEIATINFFGNQNQHFKLVFGDEKIELVYFGVDNEFRLKIASFMSGEIEVVWFLVKISQSTWNNKTSLNLIVVN